MTCISIASVALLGCKPAEETQERPPAPIEAEDAAQLFAEQVCAGLYECGCDMPDYYSTQDECVVELRGDYQAMIDPLLAGGGTWNAECAGEMVAVWSQWECLGPVMAEREGVYDPRLCPVLKGTLELGAQCENNQFGDGCREGLVCVSNTCVEPPVLPVPIGGVCKFDWETLPCAAGSYCAYIDGSDERVCLAKPVAGDPCDPAVSYLCGPSANDLVCGASSSVCEPAPAAGEPCYENFLCGPGNYCDGGKGFTCQPRFELGDTCAADAVCPVDAWCSAGICEARPARICGF